MRSILYFLTILAGLGLGPALGQQVASTDPPRGIACAYNASPPTIGTGNAGWVQCDINGKLLTSGTTTGGGAVTAAPGSYSAGALVDIINLTGTKAAGTAAASSLLAGSVYNSSPLTLSTGQQAALQSDTNGYLNVHIQAGAGSGGTASSFGSAYPATGTAAGAEYLSSPPTLTTGQMVALQTDVNGNLKVNVNNTNANGQTTMSASSPVAIASDQSAIAVKGNAANGSAVSGNPNLVAGYDGTNARTLLTKSDGTILAQLGATGQVAVSVAPVTATNTATVVDLRPDSPGIITLGPTTTANSVSHVINSQYPANSATTTPTPLVAKATGTTSAVTGTITPAATATAYLCGFDVSYIGGTAAVGPITVTGLLGGTWTYQLDVASATVGKTFSKEFNMCVPASAVNTAISVVTTADGTATAVDVQLHGYGL